MLSIGNKKYRNLQEQVGYNTECIKKIDEYLDGIKVEDKLVVIESDSGTLTNEELVVLSGPLAFISNEDKVWIKVSETDSQFVYKAIDIEASEVGNAYFNVGGSKIVVNRGDGSYSTSSDTIITTYSKNQVDSIVSNIMAVKADKLEVVSNLALKADVAGQAFTGAITAPSIIEDMSGYSFSAPADTSNISREYQYVGAVKNGNKVTFVIFSKINILNNVPAGTGVTMGTFTIPLSVGNKIYPYTIGGLDNVVSGGKITMIKDLFSGTEVFAYYRKTSAITINGLFYSDNILSAGNSYLFRLEATFLLGDNLAS